MTNKNWTYFKVTGSMGSWIAQLVWSLRNSGQKSSYRTVEKARFLLCKTLPALQGLIQHDFVLPKAWCLKTGHTANKLWHCPQRPRVEEAQQQAPSHGDPLGTRRTYCLTGSLALRDLDLLPKSQCLVLLTPLQGTRQRIISFLRWTLIITDFMVKHIFKNSSCMTTFCTFNFQICSLKKYLCTASWVPWTPALTKALWRHQ